jgi:hypothetical protein
MAAEAGERSIGERVKALKTFFSADFGRLEGRAGGLQQNLAWLSEHA